MTQVRRSPTSNPPCRRIRRPGQHSARVLAGGGGAGDCRDPAFCRAAKHWRVWKQPAAVRRHQYHPGGFSDGGEWHRRAVLHRPRGVHVAGRICRGVDCVLRLVPHFRQRGFSWRGAQLHRISRVSTDRFSVPAICCFWPPAWQAASCRGDRMGCRPPVVAIARRLSGDCHAWFWRNRPGDSPGDAEQFSPARPTRFTPPLSQACSPSSEAALGFIGIPTYSTVFWVWTAVIITLAATIRLKLSSYGRGADGSRR